MRSRQTKLLVLLFLVGVLALGSTLVAPEAEAIGGCRCGSQKTTNIDWGFGYTCSEAEADLRAKLDTQIFCAFGLCGKTLVVTTECHAHSATEVQIDGYYAYTCQICWD